MTQEEKQELFIALCGYIPYETKIQCNTDFDTFDDILTTDYIHGMFFTAEDIDCIPYLRPMDSMTTEERMEFAKLFNKWHDDELFDYIEEGVDFSIWKHKGMSASIFDWLNFRHFDYRGLIEKGLALEATEGMYNNKTE